MIRRLWCWLFGHYPVTDVYYGRYRCARCRRKLKFDRGWKVKQRD